MLPALGAALMLSLGASGHASLEEGVGVTSDSGRFDLSLGVFGQVRHSLEFTESQPRHQYSVPVLRPTIRARLWGDRVHTWVMPELAGTPELLDATAIVHVHDAFEVQLGQFRPWLSRGYRTGLTVQALGERGEVVDTFRVDRDVGVTLRGRPLGGRFEYYVGALNGEGKNTAKADRDLLYTARMVVAPLGPVPYDQAPYLRGEEDMRLAFGVSGYTVEAKDPPPHEDAASPRRREVGASADLVASGWRLAAMLEGFWRGSYRRGDSHRAAWGAYGQVAALLVRDRLDIAARAGLLAETAGVRVPFEAGFNVYLAGHHAKVQARYACVSTAARPCGEHSVMAQLQLAI